MKKNKWYLLVALVVVLVSFILTYKKQQIRKQLLLAVASIVANQQQFWFYYAPIDSLYSEDKFHYFLFYKEGEVRTDRDSTVLILSKEGYSSDSLIKDINNKVYLPLKAFPYIMNKEDKSLFCRIDSIERKEEGIMYKLHKIDF